MTLKIEIGENKKNFYVEELMKAAVNKLIKKLLNLRVI
jgi:hypothetical protein